MQYEKNSQFYESLMRKSWYYRGMKPNWTPKRVKLGQIAAWDGNPRMSTKAQAQRIIASERKFGQPVPFLLQPETDGRYPLLDGHQRLAAWFTVYGADYEMDAMVADRPLTEAEHKELVITLHTGATGSWNWDALAGWSAGDLQEWGMNGDALKAWNNDANNLKELLNADTAEPVDAEPQIDRAAELQQKWGTKTGDLWKLGEHRLLIGDCTVRENVERLMGGERADITVTSPPYYNQRPEYSIFESYEKYNEFLSLVVDNILSIANNVFILAWNTGDNQADCLPMIADQTVLIHNKGLTYLDTIIWKKSGAVYSIPRSAHIRSHNYYYPALAWEPIIIFRVGDKMPKFNEKDVDAVSKFGINVWELQQVNGGVQDKIGHPAMYPVELAERVLMSYSEFGGIAFEPFGGSGTTIIAAHNLNRRCYAMEISENYGAVILERFYTATGITPELLL